MSWGKAVKVGAAVAGTALLGMGAWISIKTGGSTQKATKKSTARREGGSSARGRDGNEDHEGRGLGTGLLAVIDIAGAALLALCLWMLIPSPGSGDPDNRRNGASEGRRVDHSDDGRVPVDRRGGSGGGGDRIPPNPFIPGKENRFQYLFFFDLFYFI